MERKNRILWGWGHYLVGYTCIASVTIWVPFPKMAEKKGWKCRPQGLQGGFRASYHTSIRWETSLLTKSACPSKHIFRFHHNTGECTAHCLSAALAVRSIPGLCHGAHLTLPAWWLTSQITALLGYLASLCPGDWIQDLRDKLGSMLYSWPTPQLVS